MALNLQVFTNVGISMLGQADAGQTLHVTRIVVGSGSANQDSDLYPLTQLIQWQADVTINRQQDLGNGVMLVSGTLNEWDMPAGSPFQLKELGIMAYTTTTQITGAGAPPVSGKGPLPPDPKTTSDQLYCVSNVYHDAPQTITPGGTNSWAFNVQVEIDRATSVVIQVGAASTYDCENVPVSDVTDPGWYFGRQGNVFEFKRAVEGSGIQLDSTTYSDRIIISTRSLTQDLDLYVPVNNPDGAGKPHFASIQAAHDYLLQFTIPPQYYANIHVHELNHAVIIADPTNFSHPNSSQINLIGENPVSLPIQSITPGTGSAKICHMTNTAGLTVNKYVAIVDSFWGYGGGCYITAVSPNVSVTCNTYDQGGQPVYGKTDTGGSHPRLVYLPTTIQISATPTVVPSGFFNFPYGIGTIQYICFVGDPRQNAPSNNLMNYVTYIIDGGGIGGQLVDVWCFNGRRGFNLYAGTWSLQSDRLTGSWNTYCAGCIATNCAYGILALSTVTAFDRTYVNGCNSGISPSGAGTAIGSITGGMDWTVVYVNHCLYGVYNSGGLFLGGSYVFSCNWHAVQNVSRGSSTFGAAYPSLFEWNTGATLDTNLLDITAVGNSYVWWDCHGQNPVGGAFAPRTNIPHDDVTPANLLTGQLSYIHIQDSGP
jgi:hypothetical protein